MSLVGKGDSIKIPKANDDNEDDIERWVKRCVSTTVRVLVLEDIHLAKVIQEYFWHKLFKNFFVWNNYTSNFWCCLICDALLKIMETKINKIVCCKLLYFMLVHWTIHTPFNCHCHWKLTAVQQTICFISFQQSAASWRGSARTATCEIHIQNISSRRAAQDEHTDRREAEKRAPGWIERLGGSIRWNYILWSKGVSSVMLLSMLKLNWEKRLTLLLSRIVLSISSSGWGGFS